MNLRLTILLSLALPLLTLADKPAVSIVYSHPALPPPDTCIAIPSAFTPNGDGKNDTFGPQENGCRISAVLIRVYNRWGQVLFESEKMGNNWDGTHKGKPVDTGFYPYICYYTPDDGLIHRVEGTVTLIR